MWERCINGDEHPTWTWLMDLEPPADIDDPSIAFPIKPEVTPI
jgi:hypothetical protein